MRVVAVLDFFSFTADSQITNKITVMDDRDGLLPACWQKKKENFGVSIFAGWTCLLETVCWLSSAPAPLFVRKAKFVQAFDIGLAAFQRKGA